VKKVSKLFSSKYSKFTKLSEYFTSLYHPWRF